MYKCLKPYIILMHACITWCTSFQNLSTSNQDLVKNAKQLSKLLSKTLNNDTSRVTKTKDNTGS